jgi:tRNA dimethylallyltransferase
MSDYNCIVVLGPTASGKTKLACNICYALGGEVISADSRQVYKGLDIGTGKDLSEYEVNGKKIPYHLIDIAPPDRQFYLHEFVNGLSHAFNDIVNRQKLPVICGGTGLYLDALSRDYSYTQVNEDPLLREELAPLSREELVERLAQFPADFTKHVDVNSRKRLIRGIEVATHMTGKGPLTSSTHPPYKPYYIGIKLPVSEIRQRISHRLAQRMRQGLIDEVKELVNAGLTFERLEHLGLEYKFIAAYLQGELSKEVMAERLQTAICQFAKRQMTWFRKMERSGVQIHWVEQPDMLALTNDLKSIFRD